MEPPIYEKNLLAHYLYTEWMKDRGRTLSWWAAHWRVPLTLLEKWVQGSRQVGPANTTIFADLPFTAQDYYESAWDVFLSDEPVPDLPREFVVGTALRAEQRLLPQSLIPTQRSQDASTSFGLFRQTAGDATLSTTVVPKEHDLAAEVLDVTLERGRLTKEEIVETWGLDDEQYREVHKILCADKRLESGPRHTGGVVVKQQRVRSEDGLGPSTVQLEGWARTTADRLEAVLSQSELLKLVADLESGIRNARRILTGDDRPSRKSELAAALILQHGADLFRETDIRKSVAKALKIVAPDKWHPGKSGAARFVEESGFPPELVGMPTPETLPDMEYLEGRFRIAPLEKFQREVLRGMLETLQDPPGRRCIVTLPTGGGKTRVAVESISFWMYDRYDPSADRSNRGTVVWLAHTEELCEQACACFRQVWQASEDVPPMALIRFWGSYTKDLVQRQQSLEDALLRPTVIVSTPHRLASLFDGNAQGSAAALDAIRANLGLIVVDEAHRAAAPMYRKLLALLSDVNTPKISIVGLTATPFRMEYLGDDPERGTQDLKEIFHKIVEPIQTLGENPRLKLQEMEVLAAPLFDSIETGTRIRIPDPPQTDMLTEEEIERIDRVMAIRADNAPRRMAVLKRLLTIVEDPTSSVLYFGPTVRDA
ncbi:MAG: DEAD/DEAH box helicase family protein, partial [Acidobacteriota bacterium]